MRLSILFVLYFIGLSAFAETDAQSTPAATTTKSSLDVFDPELDARMQKCLHPPPPPAPPTKPDQPTPPPPDRTHVAFAKVDDLTKLPVNNVDGNLDDLKQALKTQLDHCNAMSAKTRRGRIAQFGCVAVNADEYCVDVNKRMLDIANQKDMTYPKFMDAIHSQFDWYQSQGRDSDSTLEKTIKKGDTQMTGYYAPASLQLNEEPNGYYQYPVYRNPQKTDRHYTREQIDNGAILDKKTEDGQSVVIGYAHDPVDIAFLQVQGAGPVDIQKRDGTSQHLYLNTGVANGYKRSLLGSVLKCAGQPRSVWGSMGGIRKFLNDPANRQMRRQLMNYNQTYLYFDDSHNVALGAEGLELTKRVSLAVDPQVIPIGSPVLFNVKHPPNTDQDCKPITAMGVAQDTGSAIKLAHMDWYQGEGEEAASNANAVNCPSQAFVPLIQGEGVEISGCPP